MNVFLGKGADADFETSRRDISYNTGLVTCTVPVVEKGVDEISRGVLPVLYCIAREDLDILSGCFSEMG